jgi:hypothetical protein
MMLIFLIVMLLLVFSIASSAARAMRRRQEEQRFREELAAQAADPDQGEAVSPFAGMPFGGLLEQLFSMGGARSLAFDPETGRWVDITDQGHLFGPDEASGQPDPVAETTPPKQLPPPKRTTRPRSSAMANPLSGLFGAGGDGSGEFDVEPPEELGSFKDVGGMESLKEEVRDTIGLMLQHPEDAERYGIEWNWHCRHHRGIINRTAGTVS